MSRLAGSALLAGWLTRPLRVLTGGPAPMSPASQRGEGGRPPPAPREWLLRQEEAKITT